MPAYEITSRFAAGLGRLSAEQRRRFSQAVAAFVDDLRTGAFRPGLRVKGVRRAPRSSSSLGKGMAAFRLYVWWRRTLVEMSILQLCVEAIAASTRPRSFIYRAPGLGACGNSSASRGAPPSWAWLRSLRGFWLSSCSAGPAARDRQAPWRRGRGLLDRRGRSRRSVVCLQRGIRP